MTATALGTQTASGIGAGGKVGSAPIACDATNGNTVYQDGRTLLRFSSTPGGTVVFTYPVLIDGQTVPTKTATVPASGVLWVAPALGSGGLSLYPGNLIPFKASAATVFVEVVNF